MRKEQLIDRKSIKLKGSLSVMDKFKLKSINSIFKLKIGDTIYGRIFNEGVIKELILLPSYLYPDDYTPWIILDLKDNSNSFSKSVSLNDNNICNGGYNPYLIFSKESDYLAYEKWSKQPNGKGSIIGHDSKGLIFKKFSIKSEKKSTKELAAYGFLYKLNEDYPLY